MSFGSNGSHRHKPTPLNLGRYSALSVRTREVKALLVRIKIEVIQICRTPKDNLILVALEKLGHFHRRITKSVLSEWLEAIQIKRID